MKCLIYIVCYNAELHIADVLRRIPEEYRSTPDIRVLISDDCSADNTARVAWEVCNRLGYTNFEVIKTKTNQGYGGNQKIGYTYACNHGYDYVVLLHGDGQYAPEALPRFFEFFAAGADVILGSRMLNKKDALKGGMPFYKFLANMALTLSQNLLSGMNLAEFHTGYRAYATSFLKEIPFELNSNNFDFDTDILLQAQLTEKVIREFPINTFYGDETCHVNGIKYGIDILKTSIRYRLQLLGIGSSLKFKGSKQKAYKDKDLARYSSHYFLLELIKKYNPRNILEIGSGAQQLTAVFAEKHLQVTSINLSSCQNDEELCFLPGIPDGSFDMVCLMDVLEQLKEPEKLLLRLRSLPQLENALFVISAPNVAFFSMRIGLLFGRFNYSDRGILDINHKRLFTYRSLHSVLEESGFRIQETIAVPPPFYLLENRSLSAFLTELCNLLNRVMPGLFSFQVMKVARPIPTSTYVMENLLDRVHKSI